VKIKYLIIATSISVCFLTSLPVMAETFSVNTLQSYMTNKNYFGVQSMLESNCIAENRIYQEEDAAGKSYTPEEKLANSEKAIECLSTLRGVVLSSTTDFQERENAKSIVDPLIAKTAEKKKEDKSNVDFFGLNWGVGLGYSVSEDEAIDDAVIVNGIVRVKSRKKEQPRVLFEFHKFIGCKSHGKEGTRGCGPFVAIAATGDDVLSGVGMGFMYGFKAKKTDTDGFSIGLGAILDANVKDLADGFEENQAPPAGETAVRFEEKSRWSAVLFVTRTF